VRIEVGGESYEVGGWRMLRLYALLVVVVVMSAVLYLRTTGDAGSVFTSLPAILVYLLLAWALLLSKEPPAFLERFR
jgi:uncharacterized membrane protein